MRPPDSRTVRPMRVIMVVPTYQEADNIAWILQRLRTARPDVDVLVVDDNSPDGTGRIADDLAAADPQVHVLHRVNKGGLGAAYRHGFAHALEAGYDVIGGTSPSSCTGSSTRSRGPTAAPPRTW